MKYFDKEIMKKISVALFVLISIQLIAQDESVAPEKLKNFKLDWLKVKLPQNFVLMEDEAFFRTTASTVKPDFSYRDPSAQVTFTVNNSVNRWGGDDLALLLQFQKSTLLSLHKEIKIIREEIIEVKKRKYLILTFDSKIDDNATPDGKKRVIKHYQCLVYTVKKGHLITMALRMPQWMKEEGWAEAADEIIESIRVK